MSMPETQGYGNAILQGGLHYNLFYEKSSIINQARLWGLQLASAKL